MVLVWCNAEVPVARSGGTTTAEACGREPDDIASAVAGVGILDHADVTE